LPQADVVSLILTGTLSSTDTSTSVLAQSGLGTAASLLTDALINAPISKASNKLFGLSRLEISPVIAGTGSTPTARLTAARRLSKDLVITYSTNIASDPNQVLAVEYRLSNRLSFAILKIDNCEVVRTALSSRRGAVARPPGSPTEHLGWVGR
jgi:translocation and assembly module TamB